VALDSPFSGPMVMHCACGRNPPGPSQSLQPQHPLPLARRVTPHSTQPAMAPDPRMPTTQRAAAYACLLSVSPNPRIHTS
jgi:hypothetical protein